jgi:hypothetical protein
MERSGAPKKEQDGARAGTLSTSDCQSVAMQPGALSHWTEHSRAELPVPTGWTPPCSGYSSPGIMA